MELNQAFKHVSQSYQFYGAPSKKDQISQSKFANFFTLINLSFFLFVKLKKYDLYLI